MAGLQVLWTARPSLTRWWTARWLWLRSSSKYAHSPLPRLMIACTIATLLPAFHFHNTRAG